MGLFQSKEKIAISQVGEVSVPNTPEAWVELVGIIGTRMLSKLPTEEDFWWFVVEQFDRSIEFHAAAKRVMFQSPLHLHEIEYEGRRSEKSYVGHPNPGVVMLQAVRSSLEKRFNPDLAELVVANTYISFVTTCLEPINQIRMKYAVHFHNNCVSSHSYNYADKWRAVIKSLGGD